MLTVTRGATEKFLADVDRAQTQMQRLQSQLSSGLRVQQPSDDPAALDGIASLQNQLGMNQQIQTNLGGATADVQSADTTLQTAIRLVDNAISLGAQGASSTTDAQQRSILAAQVEGLLDTMVGLSQTKVNGRFIFSGDRDDLAAYKLDLSQASGVSRLITAPSTRLIQDVNGTTISVAKTAGEIFDLRNANDTPAGGNVFAALNALRVALEANDSAGIATAQSSLKQAGDHLNTVAVFYGNVETRLASATALAQKFQVTQKARLGELRDTDVVSATLELSQTQNQQQAALASQAKISKLSLFDFLS